MDDLLSEFLTETNENLAQLDLELVKLEQNPNPAILSSIFRIVHTIKGTCGFLGLQRLERVAHASENVLGKIRDGEMAVTSQAVGVVLESLDEIKALLAAIEEKGAEPEGDDSALIARLDQLTKGAAPASAAPKSAARRAAPAEPPAPPVEMVIEEEEQEQEQEKEQEEAPVAVAPPTPPPRAPAPLPAPRKVESAPDAGDAPLGGHAMEMKESALAAQNIRVNVDLLENLMTMVGELVLTRNQLMQILRSQKDSEFGVPLQRLSHVTTELQEGVMKTRMQPIGNAWAKLPRIVRDLSHELGKKIELHMSGAETELDRQVLEMIKDPLTHMVRNSADHGIEPPADRRRGGKPEMGTISLNAYHEGGHIIIEISDDGRGLDIDKIKQKALVTGLAGESELAAMNDAQIQQFIFRPGFSTADQVTSVSGRGVGMDVVRTNLEKIGGTVEMKSQRRKGSTFVIKIPLTLAIVAALIVECAGERFAIPQLSVVELVRTTSNADASIEWLNNAPVLRLRNRLLPLVSLYELLKLGRPADRPGDSIIVITQVGPHSFGIIVDRVFDTEEIVVKPVAPLLRDVAMFSGNTILGDGSVIMILDPNGIAASSGEIVATENAARAEPIPARVGTGDDRTSLLLFRAGGGAPKAVELAFIARLEEIDLAKVEHSNGRPVVQYRGKLMPLLSIDPERQVGANGRQPTLVFADKEHIMGLVVDEIVDIVEESLDIQLTADRPGLLGSAVVSEKATDIIDAGFYLSQAHRDWFGVAPDVGFANGQESPRSRPKERSRRLLLIDDSPFFRNMLTPLLASAGYEVTTAESGDHALRMCDAGEEFDIIVSDIEMPGMNGFEFATAVKTTGRWQSTPLVALSAHATQKDIDRGRAAGFSDYVAKFDRDALLQTLSDAIDERGAA